MKARLEERAGESCRKGKVALARLCLVGHGQHFGFNSFCDEKPFEHKSDRICFVFISLTLVSVWSTDCRVMS